jgi:hypothetical protein
VPEGSGATQLLATRRTVHAPDRTHAHGEWCGVVAVCDALLFLVRLHSGGSGSALVSCVRSAVRPDWPTVAVLEAESIMYRR